MTGRARGIDPDKGLIGKGPPIVENKDDNVGTFSSVPYTCLESLFAFAQFLLDLECSGLKFTARPSSINVNKRLAGHRPLILENKAECIGEFSLLAPLLESVFAFDQLSSDFQCSGLEMTGLRRCMSHDKSLAGNGPLNGENKREHVGGFSFLVLCDENVFQFAQISFDFQCRGLKITAQVCTITHNEDLDRNDPCIV